MPKTVTIRGTKLAAGDPVYYVYPTFRTDTLSECLHELPQVITRTIAKVNDEGTSFAFTKGRAWKENGRWNYLEKPEQYFVNAAELAAAMEEARRAQVEALRLSMQRSRDLIERLHAEISSSALKIEAIEADASLDGPELRELFPHAGRFREKQGAA